MVFGDGHWMLFRRQPDVITQEDSFKKVFRKRISGLFEGEE